MALSNSVKESPFNQQARDANLQTHMNNKLILRSLLGTLLFSLNSCGTFLPIKKRSEKIIAETPKEEVKKEVKKVTPKPKQTALKTYYGIASWYSIKTNFGRTTASGRLLSNGAYTAAHKKLPFGTKVRVTSLFNGKSEVLRITDRGPYVKGRIIDVTIGSAKRLGFYSRGITKVKVEVLEWGTWKYRKP